ncbi:MAG TPA: N-acetylmuramoyl-L-alanine amidase [Rhizomicrobium sp.]|nr:N-acetylmuramoyl-L-alanine amidase [Rhizomicrobium sp.]
MRLLRDSLLAIAVCLAFGAAVAQPDQGPSQPQSVDQLIDNILKEKTPKTPAPKEAVVLGVRIGEHPDRTRFVVELSDPVEMRTFTLNNPNRVVIDMPAVRWHLQGPPRPSANGAIKGYRYGLFRPGNSRFVIDLNRPAALSDVLVLPPENGYGYRVVLDLFPTAQAKFDQEAGWPADLKAKEQAADMASLPQSPPLPQTPIKKVIVIDPGHGGVDSGTVGADGTLEKDLVLGVALKLRNALEKRGYTVHMTRDTDEFVDLPQRVRIARSYHADLFISIHADSIHDPDVAGLSIYTLSEKGSDKEAADLARRENNSDKLAGVDLSGENSAVAPILIDLAQRDTMNKSSHFAEIALSDLAQATDILPRQPHRSAAFVVLKAPDVPSALIELGYLSNSGDADRMQKESWRARVAIAIAAAVDRQFMTAAQAGPATARSTQ